MRAIRVSDLGGPESVSMVDVAEPDDIGSVIIDVHAAGVTFPDVLQTRGEYQIRHPLPFTLGSEVAGVVRRAPEGARVRQGDRVISFQMSGGYAEVFAADPRYVFRIPDRITFAQAAALPVNYFTSHFSLIRRGRLVAGETVLVHGAGGGIGTATCQIAAALGARVIAVVSTDGKADVARRAGAHEIVFADDFLRATKALTDARGVDLVVDPVGGDRFVDSLRALAPEGRVVVVGFTGGSIPEVKVNRLLLNNTEVIGAAWGTVFFADPVFAAAQWSDLAAMLESGLIDPIVGARFALADAAKALIEIDERRASGKVVLDVASASSERIPA